MDWAFISARHSAQEFVVKSTNNGNSWDTYQNNETIRKVINLYFEKLNQYRGLSGVLTAEEIANRKFEYLGFTPPRSTLIERPMMLHGEPAGKTTLLLKFAKYLANTFGKALYVSSEEIAASTMTEKVNALLNPFPENLEFAENLKDPISQTMILSFLIP
jgi:hypothetical protein